MLNQIFNFIKNNLTLVISVISLALSIYNFSYSLYIRHKKLELQILKYRYISMNGYHIYQFQIIIINKSQLPISVNNISTEDIYCKFDPTRITDKVSTFQFPILLNSLEAKSGWLEFKTESEIDINSMYFNFYTSRGLIDDIVPLTDNIIDNTLYRNDDL